MQHATETHGLSLAEALRIVRRRIGVILLCLAAFLGAAAALSFAREKQYTASASLLLRDPGFDQRLSGSVLAEPTRDPNREAATNVRLLSLDVVADRTARRIPGRESVSDKVDVSSDKESDVISVTATDSDPDLAARIANTFAREYIAFRREADRAKIAEARTLVRQRLDELPPEAAGGTQGRSLRAQAEELDVFSALLTGNAELVQRAEGPSAPSSPRPFRTMVLGGILGLLAGVGLAFLLERFDRRLRDPHELEAIFERPILGVIPHSRALVESGPARERLPAGESEAFRMLRANLRYFNVDRDVRSVLLTSAASGDGKSTVAWNLASAAASAGARTLLIEADLRHPSLSPALGQRDAPGLSTVLAGDASMVDAVQQILVTDRRNGARETGRTMDVLLSGPLPPNPTDLLESARMRELMKLAEEEYDLVVIDTPPTSVVSDAIPLVNEVGGVIVVGRLNKTTRDSVARLQTQLKNLDAPTLGVVVNAVGKETPYGSGYLYGYEHAKDYAPADSLNS